MYSMDHMKDIYPKIKFLKHIDHGLKSTQTDPIQNRFPSFTPVKKCRLAYLYTYCKRVNKTNQLFHFFWYIFHNFSTWTRHGRPFCNECTSPTEAQPYGTVSAGPVLSCDVRLAHLNALLFLQGPGGTIGRPSELISRPRVAQALQRQ